MEMTGASAGGEILSQLVSVIRRYILLTAAEADAVALWIVHTHAFNAAGATPYLAITSAEKRSGKTNLLELLEMLVAKPWLTGSVSAAVLFRKTAAERPTLLLDESDATFNGNREYGEALRGILIPAIDGAEKLRAAFRKARTSFPEIMRHFARRPSPESANCPTPWKIVQSLFA